MSIIFPTYSEKKSLSKSKQKKFCIWQIVTNRERKRMRKLALSDEILLIMLWLPGRHDNGNMQGMPDFHEQTPLLLQQWTLQTDTGLLFPCH